MPSSRNSVGEKDWLSGWLSTTSTSKLCVWLGRCVNTWVKRRGGKKILKGGTTFCLRYMPTFYSGKLASSVPKNGAFNSQQWNISISDKTTSHRLELYSIQYHSYKVLRYGRLPNCAIEMNFLFSTRNPYQAAVDKLTLTLTSVPHLSFPIILSVS